MKKGFTLVELLIVIAILAVLSTATLVVLNPAEMLAQARDGQRVTDMNTLNKALGTYISNVAPIDLDAAVAECGIAGTKGSAYPSPTTGSFAVAANITPTLANSRLITGVGWVPVNFAGIPGGSPVATLPVDPTSTGDLVYRYACSNTNKTYELNCVFESDKFKNTLDYDGKDGGNQATFYELGTALNI